MDKFTRKTSFEQWFSPFYFNLFDDMVKAYQLIRLLYKEALYGFISEMTVVRSIT